MRRNFLPSALMLVAAFSTLTSTVFAQSGSTNLGTSGGSVLSGPVETLTDGGFISNGPVFQDMVFEPAVEPMMAPAAAPKPKGNPAAKAYKGVYYANDFSYLTPDYDGPRYLGDNWKNLDVGRGGKLSIGGEYRFRYHSERGQGAQAGALGFQDTDNDFGLGRLRLFADYKATDRLRFYIEGLYAFVPFSNDEYTPRGVDENFGDIQNLFADVKVSDNTTVRIGRQELLYSAQRLISPLDWINVRQKFQGVRTISNFDRWKVDTFWTQPVPVIADEFDRGTEQTDFFGGYLSFKGFENADLDLYYIGLDTEDELSIDTFGTRFWGSRGDWLYDFQGNIQTGENQLTGQDIEAYAVTAGLGRSFKNRRWKPTLWFYYDFASGDESSTGETFEQFNQLFPLAHKYLGFIDSAQRENIAAPNVQLTLQPTDKLKLIAWYYNFNADEVDSPIPGVAFQSAQDLTNTDFGNEIDLIASWNINPRNNVLFGYSHFFRGDRIIGTNDADFFYVQLTRRF